MVDLHTITLELCRFLEVDDHFGSSGPLRIPPLADGALLLNFIVKLNPSCFWSQFSLSDARFHGAFVFVKWCIDSGIAPDMVPDAIRIISGQESPRLLQLLKEMMTSLSRGAHPAHSGPVSEESSECKCLQCRWRGALVVMCASSHAWSPSRLPHSVRRLVEDGVPSAAREHAWLVLSGGLNLMRSRKPDYVSLCRKGLSESSHLELIDLDISRTFQEYPDWRRKRFDAITRRILAAYSVRNRSVGYCQGLSYIAGLLVTVVSEEVAFVVLAAIVEDGLLPPDYYTTLQGPVIDRRVLESLIADVLPDLASALGDSLEDYSFISIPWNMCLFSTSLPLNVSVRLWDFLFAFGPCVLFRVGLGLLRELESALTVGRLPVAGLREKIREIESKTTTDDVALYCAQFPEVTNERVSELRESFRTNDGGKSQMSVRDGVQESLSSCVSDDCYFGAQDSQRATQTERRRRRESKHLALAGLASFMGHP